MIPQEIDKKGLLVKPSQYLKDKSQLPPHITFEEYKRLRLAIPNYWTKKKRFSKRYQMIVKRDVLLIDYMFECGGRIIDIVNITFNDYEKNILQLYTRKRKKTIGIDISNELIADTNIFMRKYNINDDERIFNITGVRAWQIIKQYATEIDFPCVKKIWKNGKVVNSTLHPHLFRHGMCIHLLNNNVPIVVISARVGHANVKITQDMYLKVTPHLQHIHVKDVTWR